MNTTNKSAIIAQLNDEHRKLGVYFLTPGCLSLKDTDVIKLVKAVKSYSDFNEDNDPYKERDFGIVYVNNQQYFWKIDYYNLEGNDLSPDPTNRALSKRVLTIMKAEEH